MGEFILDYDHARTARDPEAELYAFLESAYDVGAKLAGWDPALLGPGEPSEAGNHDLCSVSERRAYARRTMVVAHSAAQTIGTATAPTSSLRPIRAKPMGAKKTVNLENLEGLGARRLAKILLELGEEDAEIKRRLRLELAGEAGADVIAADIAKRLVTLRRAQSFIDWPKRRSFVKDIDLQREMITTKVAETRPDLALDLMWRFMGLAEPILNRVDDSYGDVGDVFRQACRDLGAIAVRASPEPIQLADRVFDAVTTNDYGEYDQLVHVVFSALRETGVARLKSRLTTALAERPKTNDYYDSETAALKRALQDIAPQGQEKEFGHSR